MNQEPTTTPQAAPSQDKPKRDVVVFAILGGALACLALITLVSMALTVFKASPAPANIPVQISDVRRSLIDFTLTNTAGQAVRRVDLRGQWLIVNFVFSSCSLSCMQVNYRMAEIQKLVANQPDVRLVSFTIDPRTDTPPVLAKFARRFRSDTNRWCFLTGERRVLDPLISQSFLGPKDPQLAGLIPGGWSRINEIALVDPRGHLRGLFPGLPTNAAARIVATLAEMKKNHAQ